VCVSVCMCVCPAIRFHISQRILSKFGGNLLRVMTRYVGYICCVCTLIFERILFKFAGNILRLTISGKDYVLFMSRTQRTRVSARVREHT
jgi:hypothetical protein